MKIAEVEVLALREPPFRNGRTKQKEQPGLGLTLSEVGMKKHGERVI
jgi:hypothetical protein